MYLYTTVQGTLIVQSLDRDRLRLIIIIVESRRVYYNVDKYRSGQNHKIFLFLSNSVQDAMIILQ